MAVRKMKRGGMSTTGYKRNSPDKDRDYNIIPSNRISMDQVDHPVMGIDSRGNRHIMQPGGEYMFPYSPVTEYPMKHGGSYGTMIALSNVGQPLLQKGGMLQYGTPIALSNLGNPILEYGGGIPMSNVGYPLAIYPEIKGYTPKGKNSFQNGYDGYAQFGGIQNFDPYSPQYKGGGIHIKPDNKGKFTTWAKSHGMGVQEAASHVLANKNQYSPTIVKRANFAHNAAGWKKQWGGSAIPADVASGRDAAMNNALNDPNADPYMEINNDREPISPIYPTPDEPVDVNMDNGQYNPGPNNNFNPWPTFANGMTDLGNAALAFGQDMNRRNQMKQQDKWMVQQGISDNAFRRYNSQGDKGDYNVNSGDFRLQKNTPYNAGMYYPKMGRYGGIMELGGGVGYVPQGPELVYMEQPQIQQSQQAVRTPRSDKDIAVSTNNPGNMKFADWMANYGARPSGISGTDGGEFAQFPDIDSGITAYKTQLFGDTDGIFKSRYYKPNTTVDKALKTWSNNGYGAEIYPEIRGKKLKDLTPQQRDELVRRQIKRESPKMFKKLHEEGYYQLGGVYDVDESTIAALRNTGYNIEYVD